MLSGLLCFSVKRLGYVHSKLFYSSIKLMAEPKDDIITRKTTLLVRNFIMNAKPADTLTQLIYYQLLITNQSSSPKFREKGRCIVNVLLV